MIWVLSTPQAEIPVAVDGDDGTVVVLAHGAGSHMEHRTMLWLSEIVKGAGAGVVRFNFAYRALGKSMPDRMPVLMETYRKVIADLRKRLSPKRLIIGGHSMGGRVASVMASEGDDVDGLLLFGYPLHPPGQFEKMRDAHLPLIQCPVLQFSGTRDEFCRRDSMVAVPVGENYKVVWAEGADHSYVISKASGNTKKDVENDIRQIIAREGRAPRRALRSGCCRRTTGCGVSAGAAT
jgi:predicted alpha/beta-hydrolase family hydrolase